MEVVEDQMEIHIHYQDAIKMDYWGREDVFGIWSQINIPPTQMMDQVGQVDRMIWS